MVRTNAALCAWCVATVLAMAAAGCSYEPYEPVPLAFSGESTALAATIVVPTMDTPAPAGKNIVWCGTFQQCWDQMRDLDEAMTPNEPADVVARLNASRIDPKTLPADSYAAVGYGRQGIVERIRTEMAARFPDVTVDLPEVALLDALAYSYLEDAVAFRTAYFDRERPLEFTGSDGTVAPVTAFGMYRDRDASINTKLARQIEVLYSDESWNAEQFVLDLDKTSQPTQLILACVKPGKSLAETWQSVQQKTRDWRPEDPSERTYGSYDALAVPNLGFEVTHAFRELEARGDIATRQRIRFRLDRSGATLASDAYWHAFCGARSFLFDRPFLIALRQRGQQDPYFVLWVDNAELLCKPR